MGQIGIVILAAGASTRLGQPKQLLPYQGKPLIEQITTVAVASHCQPIVVVLGAYRSQIAPKLSQYNIHIAFNQQWSTGMASSLQCGLKTMEEMTTQVDAMMVLLCDQPFVSTDLIQQFIVGYRRTGYPIVVSEYAGTVGVPALFDRSFFPELATMTGDVGAKGILRRYSSSLLKIPFPQGIIDIDTPEDWERLSQ
ncbi:hypothetical protein PCC7418_2391 [Halothece sp. PCC 7418]|uniref:nucleotidyltransferase family protein n=1 Tax=Halothece sp. (strain PCC 7418) TaxID=65093 RepID=UPI0002A06B8A|nr:nucleotidyltransferase family protein [Halothece sp. PCC 7418]AFZ44539.1 hypothetical protein PCC7418_2391 [Halothece sp. PCC 7418]